MLFHTPGFLFVFLPLFLVGLSLAPKGIAKSSLLLIFSYLFYSAGEPVFVFLLVASSIVDYTVALSIQSSSDQLRKRLWLVVSMVVNLGIMGFYKYGAWAISGIPSLSSLVPNATESYLSNLMLPAGISFYTFQSMAYSIDVYRGKITAERNLVSFCNYVAYLPQLVAGPIERYHRLGGQIQKFCNEGEQSNVLAGINRLCLGICLKLLIADNCGHFVDRISAIPGSHDFLTSWSIAIGFGLQIFFDFSAYTHMAIGISLLLGIRLSENFLSPYSAGNIKEFWNKWHVTLSQWFRDYLYISLGGNRKGIVRTIINLWVTFLLCGLWHGAGINYIVWGALHGAMLSVHKLKCHFVPEFRMNYFCGLFITLIGVFFAWVPFRFSDIDTVLAIWKGMLGLNNFSGALVSMPDAIIVFSLLVITVALPKVWRINAERFGFLGSTVLVMIAMFAVINSPSINKFIYFQF